MHYLIYKITNKLNNKIYVGKHKTNNKDDDYFGSGLLLSRAVEKHGQENFVKEILFECKTEEEMNQKEADIVDEEFVARDDTYNIKLGGCGGFDFINQTNKNGKGTRDHFCKIQKMGHERIRQLLDTDLEYREKYITKRRLILKHSLESNGPSFLGKHHTEETIEKMRKSKIGMYDGEKNPSFGTIWITNDKSNQKIRKTDPIPIGWRRGRKSF